MIALLTKRDSVAFKRIYLSVVLEFCFWGNSSYTILVVLYFSRFAWRLGKNNPGKEK